MAEELKVKKFRGFNISLKQGSKQKKRLSNHLCIEVDNDRTTVAHKLTLREARALRKWLDENLENDTNDSQTTSESA